MTIGSVKGLTETEQLQAEITRLTAEVESYKEDAERYRWLKYVDYFCIDGLDNTEWDLEIDRLIKLNPNHINQAMQDKG